VQAALSASAHTLDARGSNMRTVPADRHPELVVLLITDQPVL
jgi:hypothetical protein